MAVELAPITSADGPAVAQFMRANLNPRVPEPAWSDALEVPWPVEAPNHGYLLRDGGDVVGAYLAYYSDRWIAGTLQRFCNLGAWCVLESHRFHGLRLLTSLLAQDGYHFTDFSPSGNVVEVNRRLKFSELVTTTALLPNLPSVPAVRGCRVRSDPRVLLETLTGADKQVYLDHRGAAAAKHVMLSTDNESCYVMFRKDTRKRVARFRLHPACWESGAVPPPRPPTWDAPAPRDIRRWRRSLSCALRTALRVARSSCRSPGRKMFKSPSLGPDEIDYLYSELTCLEW